MEGKMDRVDRALQEASTMANGIYYISRYMSGGIPYLKLVFVASSPRWGSSFEADCEVVDDSCSEDFILNRMMEDARRRKAVREQMLAPYQLDLVDHINVVFFPGKAGAQ
jgi:hypothetical protein